VIPIAATIAVATAVGIFGEQRYGAAAEAATARLMRALIWLLLPVVAFFNIAALELTAEVGAGIAYGYVAIAVCMTAAWAIGTHVLHLPRPAVGALILAAGLANTGYLGIPFTAALFGLDDIPNGVVYDLLVSTMALITIGFSVGAAFGTVAEAPRDRVIAFLTRNPPLWATIAGFLAPDALAPDWAVEASQVLVFLILPIGFFAVGVTLAAESERDGIGFPPPLTRPVGVALALRLLVAPAVVFGLSRVVLDVPDPYVSQAAMATAINSLAVANEYGLDRPLCAEAIAWSTAIVVAAGLVLALL